MQTGGASDELPTDKPSPKLPPWPTVGRCLTIAVVTTAVVTTLSHLHRFVPQTEPYTGTAVGLCFLAVTYWLVLRKSPDTVRAYGLALGGIVDQPFDSRMLDAGIRAVFWTLVGAAVFFPPFWIGYRIYWHVDVPFILRWPEGGFDFALGQLLIIALPEEAFYRGYLQSALDGRWADRRWSIAGAKLGWGWLLSSALFAVGHFLSINNPSRLAVFFPSLLFGWLRARTGGIGASVLFHCLCNVLASTLKESYGL